MKKWLTKKYARWTIAIISALTILFGFLAYQVQFTYDHERYFSQEGEDLLKQLLVKHPHLSYIPWINTGDYLDLDYWTGNNCYCSNISS